MQKDYLNGIIEDEKIKQIEDLRSGIANRYEMTKNIAPHWSHLYEYLVYDIIDSRLLLIHCYHLHQLWYYLCGLGLCPAVTCTYGYFKENNSNTDAIKTLLVV